MKFVLSHIIAFLFIVLLNMVPTDSCAQNGDIQIFYTSVPGSFPLFNSGRATPLLFDTSEAEVVMTVASAFQKDIEMITGVLPTSIDRSNVQDYVIIVGTLGQSKLVDEIAGKQHSIKSIAGKWEAFSISIIDNPVKGIKKALLVAGSDPRGTSYGLFELSRQIGVHPFYWWADIKPKHQEAIFLKINKPVVQSPSVKYRGIFLNDEDWGLQPWAAANMDKDVKDIGPKTYERIFELLLRLKANYIWPAMHNCTKAFWYYGENPELARKYGIVLGASHCEPMLRNNVFEWRNNYQNEYRIAPKDWRYDTNKEQIFTYWDDRVKASVNNNAVYTIGMRGIHDGSMPGPATIDGKRKLLQEIITDQRGMLAKYIATNPATVPQIFCPYKEVLDVYESGLKLPDDITIAWADDNHGYIRQVSNPVEQKRSGRSGVYYHLSYFGKPADYLWLSTISPTLISYEMTKAYKFTADRLWVFNVGDIKPAELETQFALDLAWNINAWPPEKAHEYAAFWAEEIFGKEYSKGIATIKAAYYRLAAGGKPEHLNKVSFTKKEIEQRLEAYKLLATQADSLLTQIPEHLKDAYFQLVYYPVIGAYLMNQKILLARQAESFAKSSTSYNQLIKKAADAYEEIQKLTLKYNTQTAGGKWNGMMDASPRKQAVFNAAGQVADTKDKKNVPELLIAPVQKIEAETFTKKFEPRGSTIQVVTGLGVNGKGLTITGWDVKDKSQADMPYVEYKAKMVKGRMTVNVKCLPTFRLYEGLKLRYGISVNNEPVRWVSIETEADTDDWGKNVLRGYALGSTIHPVTNGDAIIRIYLPDAGLVLNTIELF